MELKTSDFEKYKDLWMKFKDAYYSVANDIFSELEPAAAHILSMGELYTERAKHFKNVISEIRRNVIGIQELHVIKNYKHSIEKEFDDIEKYIFNRPNTNEDYNTGFSDDDDFYSCEPPFYFWSQVERCLEIERENAEEDFNLEKETLIKEMEREIKFRSDNYTELLEVPTHKFNWKGTPAQLAFIVDMLHTKGYFEGLTNSSERNARLILSHFEIEGYNTTPESLGKCFQLLKKDELPINKEDAAKFQRFPRRIDLKK